MKFNKMTSLVAILMASLLVTGCGTMLSSIADSASDPNYAQNYSTYLQACGNQDTTLQVPMQGGGTFKLPQPCSLTPPTSESAARASVVSSTIGLIGGTLQVGIQEGGAYFRSKENTKRHEATMGTFESAIENAGGNMTVGGDGCAGNGGACTPAPPEVITPADLVVPESEGDSDSGGEESESE